MHHFLQICYSNLGLPTPTFIGAAVGQDLLFGSGGGVRVRDASVCVRESTLEYRYRWSHIFLFDIHFFVAHAHAFRCFFFFVTLVKFIFYTLFLESFLLTVFCPYLLVCTTHTLHIRSSFWQLFNCSN